jgi:hypothetical protein
MAKTSIYLPDDLAEAVRELDLPVSAICQHALREAAGRRRAVERNGMEQLTVQVGDSVTSVSFTGRWLVDPGPQAGSDVRYGVAVTGRGRIAVYSASDDLDFPDDLQDYDTLDQAAADGVPACVISVAAAALGHDPVVWRNI